MCNINTGSRVMKTFSRVFVVITAIFLATQAYAQVELKYTVTVDKEIYIPGETVWWEIAVDSSPLINTMTYCLCDDRKEIVYPGIFGDAFINYDLRDPGDWDESTSCLKDIEVAELFDPLNDTVSSGLLATGSYTATVLGSHNLGIYITRPEYNTYVNLALENAVPYDIITKGSDNFTVIPEPGSIFVSLVSLLGGALFFCSRRHKR